MQAKRKFPAHVATLAILVSLAACGKSGDASNTSAADPQAPTASVTPPAGSNWVETISETADSGMLMGNPNAPVKLVEYGALSCPHCARFSKESREGLKAMIAKGTVSYEFRTFLIHPQDVPASLLARCNGAGPFFPISEALFDTQDEWLMKRSQSITPAEQQSWTTMAPNAVAAVMAEKLGLVEFVKARGIGAEKAKACLADPAGVKKLETIANTAQSQYQISSTPSFIINGQKLDNINDWTSLQIELRKAGG